MKFAISAVIAAATPAVAAGLVVGTSVAVQTGNAAIGGTIYPSDESAGPTVPPQNATHGPARLSVLAGSDQAAWDSAHSVHVDFRRKAH